MLGRCRIQILLWVLFLWGWYLILPFAPLLVCLKAPLIPFFAGIAGLQQQFHTQRQLLQAAEKNLNAVSQAHLWIKTWTLWSDASGTAIFWSALVQTTIKREFCCQVLGSKMIPVQPCLKTWGKSLLFLI